MWPSLPTANNIADVANLFFIGSLVVGVVSTVLIVWMAGVKEAYWERDRQESSERIEGLHSESEKARSAIAESNAKTAIANENAAKANERTAELKIALEREIAARQPRTISQEQRMAILHNLKALMPEPKGKLYVVPSRFDPEAIQYAGQISELLKAAGFTVSEGSGTPNSILGYDAPGAWLWMSDVPTAPPHAEAIQKAFWAAGIYLDGQSHPDKFDKESVLVAVSSKPPVPFLPPFGSMPRK